MTINQENLFFRTLLVLVQERLMETNVPVEGYIYQELTEVKVALQNMLGK